MNTLNQKEAKTKRGQKVKNNTGQKTWRSKIKGGQEVKRRGQNHKL